MKKILIDAKWLHKGPPSGRVVVFGQINQLKKYVDRYEITLLVDYRDSKIDTYKKWGFKTLKILNFSLLTNIFIFPLLYFHKSFHSGLFQNAVPIYFSGKKYLFVHDIIFKSHPQFFTKTERIFFKLITVSFRFCDFVITISENEKLRIATYGYSERSNIFVIHNGVDHFLQLRNDSKKNNFELSNLKIEDDYVLYVGRINDRKNVKNLLVAMSLIQTNIKLIIVGASDWKNSVEANISDKIIHTGFVSESTLQELYKNAKAFVFVSYEEGFGLPPLEAMVNEVPVIVSNTSCFPEICGNAPIYVDPDNTIEIANEIDRVCNDLDLRRNMISLGKEVAAKYTWSGHVQKLISLIEK